MKWFQHWRRLKSRLQLPFSFIRDHKLNRVNSRPGKNQKCTPTFISRGCKGTILFLFVFLQNAIGCTECVSWNFLNKFYLSLKSELRAINLTESNKFWLAETIGLTQWNRPLRNFQSLPVWCVISFKHTFQQRNSVDGRPNLRNLKAAFSSFSRVVWRGTKTASIFILMPRISTNWAQKEGVVQNNNFFCNLFCQRVATAKKYPKLKRMLKS